MLLGHEEHVVLSDARRLRSSQLVIEQKLPILLLCHPSVTFAMLLRCLFYGFWYFQGGAPTECEVL